MRFVIAALCVCALTLALVAVPAVAQDKSALQTQQDKISYSIGLSVGKNLKNQEVDVVPEKFMLGLRDALKGEGQILTDEEVREVMFAYQMERRAKVQADQEKAGAANKKQGEDYLAANKTKKGVKSTASGLQYKVLKEGNGKSPTLESVVTAHYKGTLIDGTEFDSSYARGQPAQFPLNGVIPGWAEALQLMKVGAKYQVWIPAELAYGEQGAGQRIGPNTMLVFEIELLGIE
jgi:FKBP-type peptidyl-prolyl cis-trans isomerase FklB